MHVLEFLLVTCWVLLVSSSNPVFLIKWLYCRPYSGKLPAIFEHSKETFSLEPVFFTTYVLWIFLGFRYNCFKTPSWNKLWYSLVEFWAVDYSSVIESKCDSTGDNLLKFLETKLSQQIVCDGYLLR